MHFRTLLEPLLATLKLHLTPSQLDLLDRHYRLLTLWNRRMNLTSIHYPATIVRRHFGESLFVASCLGLRAGRLADIGSGAGFPGFPIAVLQTNLQVTLIESAAKKAAFLKEISRGVENVQVLHQRFEAGTDQYDCVVARAVALEPLAKQLGQRTRHLAVLTASSHVPSLGVALGLQELKVDPVPWKSGSVLLQGCFT